LMPLVLLDDARMSDTEGRCASCVSLIAGRQLFGLTGSLPRHAARTRRRGGVGQWPGSRPARGKGRRGSGGCLTDRASPPHRLSQDRRLQQVRQQNLPPRLAQWMPWSEPNPSLIAAGRSLTRPGSSPPPIYRLVVTAFQLKAKQFVW
jgi:hypothetical protein